METQQLPAGVLRSRPGSPGELKAAARVQERFRPKRAPGLGTLEVAGDCLAGGGVGGDFYDFLQPAPGRLVLILGDVSGHGLPAALMMAALQASLRALYALPSIGLAERIRAANRLFLECTAEEHYAGLFVGEYDDDSGRLRYVNCGHTPPLLVRDDGAVERLAPTGMPLGMFEPWSGRSAEVRLAAGDTLALVTDGIPEATAPAENEFGELRLLSAILRYRHLAPAALVRAIARDVRLSCGRRPLDDATVVVARVKKRGAGVSG